MQTIYLDISNKGVVPTVYAKQGDVGRKFEVVLTDSGLPYVPANGSAFSVWYSGASGEGNYTNIGDKSAFSVNENRVTVEMIAQMLLNEGNGIISLALNDPNGSQISTWNIPYICESVPGADSEEAKDYYTAFSKAVENLPYPDTSLSVAGKAADSAAVGAALAGKAPAGYGLGEQGSSYETSDPSVVDSFKFTGWAHYYSPENVSLIPSVAGSHACEILVEMFNHSYGRHTAYTINGYVAERVLWNGVWNDWRVRNPQMALGVEYCTTERWQGKAVYTKLVDCGAFPSGGTKKGREIGSVVTNILRAEGTSANSGFTVPYTDNTACVHISATLYQGTALIILYVEKGDLTADSCIAQIWYTKD